MNNRRAFIFALLTKLTVSPQFLLLGHLHDTENIFFFFFFSDPSLQQSRKLFIV